MTLITPIDEEVTKIKKIGEEITKNIFYILQLIDSARFMASSLSNLVDNLSEWSYRSACKYGHDDKKCETCGARYKYCNCFLEYIYFKGDLIWQKCLYCNKSYEKKFDERLTERFLNTHKFFNNGKIHIISFLQKSVCPFE